MRYLFTITNHYIYWAEAILMEEMKAEDCPKAFLWHQTTRLGVTGDNTSERGRQFTFAIWERALQALENLLHLKTHHNIHLPMVWLNGHSTKGSAKGRAKQSKVDELPIVLKGTPLLSKIMLAPHQKTQCMTAACIALESFFRPLERLHWQLGF